MNEPPLEYAGRDTPADAGRRTFSTWLILLAVWTAGLVMWALYIIAAIYLFFRVFS